MARPSKKKLLYIDNAPTLWDPLRNEDNVYSDIISRGRREQSTPQRPIKAIDMDEHLLRVAVNRTELEFISFGSGSSGNCAYLGIRGVGGIIIDAGVDANKVMDCLAVNYISPDKIGGILLTHDHSDHVRYVYQLLRKNPKMKLYCTLRVLNGILRRHSISKRIKDYHTPIFKEFEFETGPFKIIPFEVSHDASDNVGFCIQTYTKAFVVATDMGYITDRADYYMRMANYLMIESNYDRRMLDTGRYPEYLKARIRGDRGHLDNAVTAAYLAEIWTEKLTNIYLCHLSDDNNTPEVAVNASRDALAARGVTVGDGSGSSASRAASVQLCHLPRYDASPLYVHRL